VGFLVAPRRRLSKTNVLENAFCWREAQPSAAKRLGRKSVVNRHLTGYNPKLYHCHAGMKSDSRTMARRAAMTALHTTRMRNPAHPGGFVKAEIITPLGLSVTDAAQALGVTRATLSTLLNEHQRLSPEMALRIEKAFGVSMDTLMAMQSSFDIAEIRKRAAEIKVEPFKGKSIEPQPALI
jgi:addiction module HigA family antidote